MQITPQIEQDVYRQVDQGHGPSCIETSFASVSQQYSLASSQQDGLNQFTLDPEATVTLKIKDLERLVSASRAHLVNDTPTVEPRHLESNILMLMNSLYPSPETSPDLATIVPGWGGSVSSEDSTDITSLFSEDAFMGTPLSESPALFESSYPDELTGLFDASNLFGLPPSLEGISPAWVMEASPPPVEMTPELPVFKPLPVDPRGKVAKPKVNKKVTAEAVQLAVEATIASGVTVDAEVIAPTPVLAQAFPNGIRMPSNRGRSSAQAPVKGHGCNVCGRVFSRRFNLNVHMQTHDPDRARPFKCEECGAAFPRMQDLERHQSIHAEPEYSCSCGKSFVRRDALLRHQSKCQAK